MRCRKKVHDALSVRTYECARRVIAFVQKYPDREFACLQLLPILCADLPIKWHKNKCYAVMRCLLGLGFIQARYEYVRTDNASWTPKSISSATA
jgi:hypothetical protein